MTPSESRMAESAARHNITLNILGWGVAWGGLYQKLEATLQFCQSLPPNDIVLFTDAFDVMFLKTSEEILSDYTAMDTDILFGAECGCWPHVTRDGGKECLERYPASPTPYRYLNSGTWMARARAIVRVLTALKNRAGEGFAKSETNDQVCPSAPPFAVPRRSAPRISRNSRPWLRLGCL